MRDLSSTLKLSRGLSPVAAVTNDTAFVSEIIDFADFDGALFAWIAGSLADVAFTFTMLFEHGDVANLSDAAAVPDSQLIGTEAAGAPLLSSDNKVGKIGYRGSKRYGRVTLTPASNTGDIYLAGMWIQGFPRNLPQSTQIV